MLSCRILVLTTGTDQIMLYWVQQTEIRSFCLYYGIFSQVNWVHTCIFGGLVLSELSYLVPNHRHYKLIWNPEVSQAFFHSPSKLNTLHGLELLYSSQALICLDLYQVVMGVYHFCLCCYVHQKVQICLSLTSVYENTRYLNTIYYCVT